MSFKADIFCMFLANDRRKYRGKKTIITNHVLKNPKRIRQKHDELIYILDIRVDAKSDFVLDYYSDNESIELAQNIATPQVYESNIVTRHLGDICFRMSNTDDYYITIVKVKVIDN